jgi:hypothetical protein
VNLHLRGLFKAALQAGQVKPALPFEGLIWQRVDQKARELYTPSEIDLFGDLARLLS